MHLTCQWLLQSSTPKVDNQRSYIVPKVRCVWKSNVLRTIGFTKVYSVWYVSFFLSILIHCLDYSSIMYQMMNWTIIKHDKGRRLVYRPPGICHTHFQIVLKCILLTAQGFSYSLVSNCLDDCSWDWFLNSSNLIRINLNICEWENCTHTNMCI